MKVAVTTILALFLLACTSVPDVVQSTANSTSDNDPNGGGLIRNPTGGSLPGGGSCGSAMTENLSVTPDSSRGANVVLALDDSGSMTNEINHVVSVIDAFIRDLVLATQDNLRLILVFSMNGPNGSAFGSGAPNPFSSVIDNQRVFYVSQGTGSRGSDIALFKTFSMSSFQQILPSVVPSDAGGVSAASCTGAGKYFRPRALINELNGSADNGLSQTPQGCISSPGLSGSSGGALTGPISHLLSDVAVNFITVSDDDNNVAGTFGADPHNGSDLVLNVLRKIMEPLGSTTPIYYHSIVGLSNNSDPAFPGSDLARIGTKHSAMSARTSGLIEDIRQDDYNDVFSHLTSKIIYSEQVMTMQCNFSSERVPVVTLNGTVLPADKYQYSNDSEQLRLLPAAFDGMPTGSLSLQVAY